LKISGTYGTSHIMTIRFIIVSEFIELKLQSITSMAAKWPWAKKMKLD